MQLLLAKNLVLAFCLLGLAVLPAQHGLAEAARVTRRAMGDGGWEDGGDGQDGGSGDAGEGGIDVGSLEKSMKEGGVDGLNRMLQAFQAMGKIGAGGVMEHVKKDANGEEMYDFRDIDETTTSAPASVDLPVSQSQKAQPAAAPAVKAAQPAAAAAAAGKPRQPQPAAGHHAHEHSGRVHRLGAKRAKAAKDVSAPVAVPATRAAAAAAKAGTAAPAKAAAAAAPPKAVPPAAAVAAQPAAPAALVATAAPAAPAAPATSAEPEAVAALAAPAAASAPAGSNAGQLAALFSGLEEVRRGVDTLVTLGLHSRGSDGQQASGEDASQKRQFLSQLQDLRDENERLHKELKEQAKRLDAVEDDQRSEDEKLEQVVRENEDLRDELRTVQRRKAHLGRGEKDANHHGDHHVRTFFHSKGKSTDK